jgi:GTPase SAR1 family protein
MKAKTWYEGCAGLSRFDGEIMNSVLDRPLRIAVVGPCSAGKSTLLPALLAAGYDPRQPAQEHSYAPNMWQRLSKPDILIYLDLSYKQARIRRPHIDGGPQRLAEQRQRLSHARTHCDFYLDTSNLSRQEVRREVFTFLKKWHSKQELASAEDGYK